MCIKDGYYSSTQHFVYENNLESEAEKLFGKDWENEDDVQQIYDLIDFIGLKFFEVDFIEDINTNEDIYVWFNSTAKELDDCKKLLNVYNEFFKCFSKEQQERFNNKCKELNFETENKKIAEFLSWREQKDPTERFFGEWFDNFNHKMTNGFKEPLLFHSNWDWLIKAVEKIETLSYRKGRKFYLHKDSSYVQIRVDRMDVDLFSKWGTSANKDIFMAIYRAVLEFVSKQNKLI